MTSEQVLASPFGPDSFFGGLVALDEDVLVVGAPGRTVAGVSGAGSVCIYRQTPSGWALRSTIEPDPAWIVVDYGLGGSLKLRGTELLVGALGGNGSSSTPGRAGLVHHYDLSVAGTPSLTQTLRPPTGGRVTGGYGATIALDHELLLIGEGSSSNDMDGVVFRYERDAPGLPWSWSGTISGPVEGAGSPPFDGNGFGSQIILTDDTVLISDSRGVGTPPGTGLVSEYERIGPRKISHIESRRFVAGPEVGPNPLLNTGLDMAILGDVLLTSGSNSNPGAIGIVGFGLTE
ncbi:MAG: hypothetical protein AAFU73_18545, partial [Planctomycetota bacterium]